MPDWSGYLDDADLRRVRDVLLVEDLADKAKLAHLVSDLPRRYSAALDGWDLPADERVAALLAQMNRVANLRSGEVPLKILLSSAVDNVASPASETALNAALARMETGAPTAAPAASAAALAGAAAGPAVSGAELALRARLPAPAAINRSVETEALIGGLDETLSVGFLKRGVATAASIFKIVVHRHFDGEPLFVSDDLPDLSSGTAWMIGPGLAVTNFHVFNARLPQEPDASDDDYRLQAQTAALMPDYHDQDVEPLEVALGPGRLLARDKALDFAIFEVPPELAERPPLPLRRHRIRKRPEQALGLRVNLLQHPMGAPMRLGFRNNFVVLGDDSILAYLTDTTKGSSGAPVCDDGWNVAALHVGSQPATDLDLEILGTRIRRENFGVPLATILEALQADAAAVHARITAAGT